MLTLPQIIEKPAQPFFAIKQHVTLPFDDEIPAILDRLFSAVEAHNLKPSGPVLFKHNVVRMPHLEMAFGVAVDRVVAETGDIESGLLPAGRYAEITYYGPYSDLITVNAVLIGWCEHSGLAFDSRKDADGEWFSNRLEIYHNSPEVEADPHKLKTTVSIKLRD